MVPHAFGTSTSMIAFRVIFLSDDLEPKVATSLVIYQLRARCVDHSIIPDSRDSMFAIGQY